MGFRSDVDELLAAADVVVHPSIGPETFGFAIAEAMAAGRPVVVSDMGAQRELVQAGQAGLLVPPDDPDALAGACLRLLAEPKLRARLGQAGQAYANSALRAERMVAETITVLEQISGEQK